MVGERALGPVAGAERIELLDILRGVALFGVHRLRCLDRRPLPHRVCHRARGDRGRPRSLPTGPSADRVVGSRCGGLASAVSAYLTLGELTPGVARTAQSWAYAISYPLLALAYASFVASRVPLPTWHVVLGPFAGVGRMALTVYVGQSVIYTTIYYGYGLGQFGRLGAAHILPLAVLVFALEILACNWWMRRFRFGPLEWLWRSATYLEWQPMRRVACKPL